MDVRCERCRAQYVFDDEQVTPQGLTVQCTNCAHVFRVKKKELVVTVPVRPEEMTEQPLPATAAAPRPHPGAVPQAWTIRQASGTTLSFTELTTLQRWIVERKVSREDEVSQGDDAWVRLGSIGELQAFFAVVDQAERSKRPGGTALFPPPPFPPPALTPPPGFTPVPTFRPPAPAPPQPPAPHQPEPSGSRPLRPQGPAPAPAPAPGGAPHPAATASSIAPAEAPGPSMLEGAGAGAGEARRGPGPGRVIALLLLGVAVVAAAWAFLPSLLGGPPPSSEPVAVPITIEMKPAARPPAPEPSPVPEPPPAQAAQPAAAGDAEAGAKPATTPPAAPEAPAAAAGEAGSGTPAPAPAPSAQGGAPGAEPAAGAPAPAPPEPVAAPPPRPGGPQAALAQAAKLREKGKLEQALEIYGRVLEDRPDNVEALTGRGLCYLDLGQYHTAEASFEAALQVLPRQPDAMMGLAETYRAQGKTAQAIAQYERYLAAHPDGDEADVARNAISQLKE